jgi:hypothetical protein
MLNAYTIFPGSFGNDQEISSSSLSELNKKLKATLGSAAEPVTKDKDWRLITIKGELVGIYIEEPNLEYQSPYHLHHQQLNYAKVILRELKKEELENKPESSLIHKGRKIVETYIELLDDRLSPGNRSSNTSRK